MPRYEYKCAGCSGQVSKTPCHTQKEDGKFKDYAGLHGWACQKCGSGVKVSRTIR